MKELHYLELATRIEALVWTETVLFAVTNIAAFFGNLLTCYAVCRNHRLRTLPNMLVIALAVSDILMSTCCMPFTVATLYRGEWYFGDTFCQINGFILLTFGTASLLCMGVIAVSRYFCVVRPERYPVLFKKQRILMYIAVVWCTALVGSFPPLFFKKGGFKFTPGKAMCLYTFETYIGYTIFLGFVFITTPLALITICYVKVFRAVSKSNRVFSEGNNFLQLRANVEEARVTKPLVAVVVGFVFCWLPIFVMDNIDAVQGEHSLPRQAYILYAFLLYLSSTINPIIYGAMNKQLRREYKDILSKIVCCIRQNDCNSIDDKS